jgi:hypothetical protein
MLHAIRLKVRNGVVAADLRQIWGDHAGALVQALRIPFHHFEIIMVVTRSTGRLVTLHRVRCGALRGWAQTRFGAWLVR